MPTQIKLEFERFIKFHLVVPLVLFLVLFSVFELTQLDLWVSRHFYSTELHQWTYRHHWLTETVLHTGGQYFIYIISSIMLLCLLASFMPSFALKRYRRELFFLLFANMAGRLSSRC